MRQKYRAQRQKGYAPGDRITIKLTRDRIFFGVRRQPSAHQLRGATCVDCGEQPRTKYSQNKKSCAISNDRHLKEAGEDGEMNNRFRSLTVISRAQSWNKERKQRRHKRRSLSTDDVRVRGARLLITQHFDSGDNAVLAERESANAMIASEAERPRALAALHGRGVLLMIIAVH